MHSTSKYLNGHGDVLAGAVLTARRDPYWERIRSWRRNAGAMPGPFEAWLLQRGMRTLFLRVRRDAVHPAGRRGRPRRSIRPPVIARGAAAIRVAEEGVVTLEVPGSPGAVLPVLGLIEAQIRAAVPGVTAVRLAATPAPQLPSNQASLCCAHWRRRSAPSRSSRPA
jgi:Cys/Met metabolism PLP-dependent enzyme